MGDRPSRQLPNADCALVEQRRIREYLLTDFDEDELFEAIRRPTADEVVKAHKELGLA